MDRRLADLATELDLERSTLERELTEIELLMRQASSEVERHEARRVQAEERLATLQRDAGSGPGMIEEAVAHLLAQTRRQTMMQGQVEVLEGKQRALQRFSARLDQIAPVLAAGASDGLKRRSRSNDGSAEHLDRGVSSAVGGGLASVAGIGDYASGGGSALQAAPTASAPITSRDVMAAQEQMRREIARQMHDGPAQSIANIALQAHVVHRLYERDPRQAEAGLRELVAMVQHALEQTKNFIFDVRPMVLDDLGLVPTLRRAAAERTRRSGQSVSFESVGADGRLPTELESGLFRIVDDALQTLIDAAPGELLVRLDWLEASLKATVRGRPRGEPSAVDAAKKAVATARRQRSMPSALVSMIEEQQATVARGVTERAWTDIRERAEALGIEVALSADGWTVEATVSRGR